MSVCRVLAIILICFSLTVSPASAALHIPTDKIELVCPNNVAPRAGKCPANSNPYGIPAGSTGGGRRGGGGLIGLIRDIVGGIL